APVAVPLVDHVVMLRVEPSRNLRAPPEVVDEDVVVPAPVHVARAALISPYIAELGIEEGLPALRVSIQKIPLGARMRARDDLIEVLRHRIAGRVHVPRVDVRLRVPEAADRVVLHRAGPIELFRAPV